LQENSFQNILCSTNARLVIYSFFTRSTSLKWVGKTKHRKLIQMPFISDLTHVQPFNNGDILREIDNECFVGQQLNFTYAMK